MPQDFYAQAILTTAQPRAVLAHDALARRVMAALDACRADAPGSLWAYTVLPDALRLVAGPTDDDTLDAFVARVKACTTARVLASIQRAGDDTLDAVLHYNPVWGGAIYHLWAAGYHKTVCRTAYHLSNMIYALWQVPVEAGLVDDAQAWPYMWVGGDNTTSS